MSASLRRGGRCKEESEGMTWQRDGHMRGKCCCPTGTLRLSFEWRFRSLEITITMLYIIRVRRERKWHGKGGEHRRLSQPSIAVCMSQDLQA